jgi:hypothetical protein|tara:strand:- start:12373 stop:12729 length:357 start_codon:yes stop_codon:yes gene_type:complete
MLEKAKDSWSGTPKWVKVISLLSIVISSCWGAAFALDEVGLRPAVTLELEDLRSQIAGLDLRTLQMDADSIQRRIWALEDRMDIKNGGTISDKEMLRELRLHLEKVQQSIESVRGDSQ